MSLKTNLNTAPYYDDFDPDDNFHRVLFRPGYAIQARELTQLQSILQNQIELQGKHIFKEGAIVVPGEITFSNRYVAVRLKETFGGETINPSQYYDAENPIIITGQTSGVKAEVVGFSAAGDQATEPVIYVNYIGTGVNGDADRKSTDNSLDFVTGESITADTDITHTTSYTSLQSSAEIFTPAGSGSPISVGSVVSVSGGVFFVKGSFVETETQTLVLSYNNAFPTKSVGFNITEEIITPEADTTLLDNATGTNNYAAKGAHRLKINLTLATREVDDTNTHENFVELLKLDNGIILEK